MAAKCVALSLILAMASPSSATYTTTMPEGNTNRLMVNDSTGGNGFSSFAAAHFLEINGVGLPGKIPPPPPHIVVHCHAVFWFTAMPFLAATHSYLATTT
jgi:hypothetical protein